MRQSLQAYIIFILLAISPFARTFSQCVGLPPVASLGSNKFPVGLCSPVNANVTYGITFTSPVNAGKLELIYDWGDGSTADVITLPAGQATYNASRSHNFPVESDCEYFVVMTIRLNGALCTATRQVQKISSWRTDAYNGGRVKLVSPITNTSEHLVCEGTDIDVELKDDSQFSCHTAYIQQPPNTIESPNVESRWQQIIYNTQNTGSRIPNIAVDGVPVTGAGGVTIRTSYHDPRGIYIMTTPVVANDPRRRPSQRITAPGGFGSEYPKAGDIFHVTIRYWNFCNPYDDPSIPGPPSDPLNGDHAPVESTAVIRIQAAPQAPTGANQSVCNGTTPSSYSINGVTAGSTVKWYAHDNTTGLPGRLLSSGTATTFAITAHPDWQNNTTSGVYKIWASYEPRVAGATNCESPKVMLSRTIRENIVVPDANSPVPDAICNNTSFTVTMPAPATEAIAGATNYTWAGSSGLVLSSSTATSATFTAGGISFGAALYADRNFTVTRRYSTSTSCARTRTYTVRIHKEPAGGTLSATPDVCEGVSVGTITLSGYSGNIVRWEMKKDGGNYAIMPAPADATVNPGILSPGTYTFRAVVTNAPCHEVYSSEEKVTVYSSPAVPVFAGNDQFVCTSLSSVALGASDPAPGTGKWSYVSSVPANLPAPAFSSDLGDRNTMISIQASNAGAYTLRWTVTNGTCISYDDVVVDFGTDPTAPNAGADRRICGPATILEGNTPQKGLGSWSIVSGPNGCTGADCPLAFTAPASATTAAELKAPHNYGTYVLRWTITSGGNNCFLKYDDVNIIFDKPATITASDISGICLDPDNLMPIVLSGSAEGAAGGEWVKVSGKGTVSPSTTTGTGAFTISATYTPTLNDYHAGVPIEVKLAAKHASPNSCTDASKTIRINIDRKPVAHAGNDIFNICGDTVKLKAATPAFGATGKWTTTVAGVTFTNATDPSTVVRNLPTAPSHTPVTWTLTSASGQCVSAPATINLYRVALPTATDLTAYGCAVPAWGNPASTAIILRDHENGVTTSGATTRHITWYKNSAVTGTPVNDATLQTQVPDGQVYVARIRDLRTNCTSDARLTVAVRPLPIVKDALLQLCEDVPGSNTSANIDLGEGQYTAAITTASNVVVTWHHAAADADNNVSPITTPLTVTGRTQLYARVMQKGIAPQCYAIAKLDLAVNTRPGQTAITGREAVCLADGNQSHQAPVEIYQVTPVSGARYYWEVPDNPATQFKVFSGGKETDFFVMLQFPNAYKGKIRLRVELNGCSSTMLEKEITVSHEASLPVIHGPDAVCENDNTATFEVADHNASSAYFWDVRKVSDNAPGGAYIAEGQSTGKVMVGFEDEAIMLSVRSTSTGCAAGGIATKMIAVHKRPNVTATADNAIAAIAGSGTIRTTVTGGTAPYVTYELLPGGITSATGVFSNLAKGTYNIRVTDTNGCTAISRAVVVDAPVVPGDNTPVKASFTATPLAACFPATIQVRNNTTGANIYRWNLYESGSLVTTSNLATPSFRIVTPGTYTLKLVAGSTITDRRDSITLAGITIYDQPYAAFTLRTPTYAGATLQIKNYSERANTYTWDFGDETISYDADPRHAYKTPGQYTISVIAANDHGRKDVDGNGSYTNVVCYDSASQVVTVKEAGLIDAANAFTPSPYGPTGGVGSAGGYNDIFLPAVRNASRFHLQVFDRWGTLIFESKDQHIGWDGYDREGKLLPAGVYIYKLNVGHNDGEHTSTVGDITLIR
jgi:gliding motility-associated-like protein